MDKLHWRTIYRNKRAELSENERADLSSKIGQQLLSLLTADDQYIHVFLPIEKFHEVNTWLVKKAIDEAFPATRWLIATTDFKGEKMHHFYLEKDTAIKITTFGIPEPINAKPADIRHLTTVLIPLLAVDKTGNRLGYGKGFYDRFLAECPENCRTIGLSFFEPEESNLPTDGWDIPLQYCVTPNAIHQFIK